MFKIAKFSTFLLLYIVTTGVESFSAKANDKSVDIDVPSSSRQHREAILTAAPTTASAQKQEGSILPTSDTLNKRGVIFSSSMISMSSKEAGSTTFTAAHKREVEITTPQAFTSANHRKREATTVNSSSVSPKNRGADMTTAAADRKKREVVAPVTTDIPDKRETKMNITTMSTSTGRQKREEGTTPNPKSLCASNLITNTQKLKRGADAVTLTESANCQKPEDKKAEQTLAKAIEKREVTTIPESIGREKREAETPAGRQKRETTNDTPQNYKAEMTSMQMTTPVGRRKQKAVESADSVETETTGTLSKREAEMTTAQTYTLTGRRKREENTSPNSTVSGAPKKREADITTAPSVLHKREAEMSTASVGRREATTSSNYTPQKREAAMNNETSSISSGRRKRHSSISSENKEPFHTKRQTMNSSDTVVVGHSFKKRQAKIKSSSAPSTPSSGRRRRNVETTSLRSIKNKQATDVPLESTTGPARKRRQITKNGGQTSDTEGGSSMIGGVTNDENEIVGESGKNGASLPQIVDRHHRHANKDDDSASMEQRQEAKHLYPTPPFIKDLIPEQRRQFFEIKSNFTLTKKEMNDQLQKWLAQQSANVQEDYKMFHKNLEMIKEDIAQKIQANLSSEGKALFQKIETYMNDDSLTMRKTCENIQQAIDAAPEAVREELHCNEHMPSDGGNPPPRRIDACHGHFDDQLPLAP